MSELSWLKFDNFTAEEINDMIEKSEMLINKNYQRSSIWKKNQQQELIISMLDHNPIGVLVLWKNRKGIYEILDGQQRVRTMVDFIAGKIKTNDGKTFSSLGTRDQTKFKGFIVPYLLLEQNLSDDQVSTIFIRLQEGTTLSNGEKVYAFRGNFRDAFVNSFFASTNQNLFSKLDDSRFKARFLAAKLLFLELKSDHIKRVFPNLSYNEFKKINDEYRTNEVPKNVLKNYNKNIEFLGKYLYGMLKALSLEDIVSAYLLLSYFTQRKTSEKYHGIIFKNFIMEMQHDLHSFTIYDTKPPKEMKKAVFTKLQSYKQYNQKGITPDSLEKRFTIMKDEWERRIGKIKEKDKQRFFTQEQKITLYFMQKGICPISSKEITYGDVEADHKTKHESGGKTEVDNGRLIHHKCHTKIHKHDERAIA